MFRLFVLAMCICLARMAFANDLLVIAEEDAPHAVPTVERGPNYVTISYPASEGETAYSIGLIRLNYLDAGYMAELLGGTAIRLTPIQSRQNRGGYQPWNNQYPQQNGGYPNQGPYDQQGYSDQRQPRGGYPAGQGGAQYQGYSPARPLQGVLNQNAPLYSFVPAGVQDIVGLP